MKLRLILKIYHDSGSYKKTARQLKMSKNTIKNYVRQAQDSGYELETLIALQEDAFEAVFNHCGINFYILLYRNQCSYIF